MSTRRVLKLRIFSPSKDPSSPNDFGEGAQPTT